MVDVGSSLYQSEVNEEGAFERGLRAWSGISCTNAWHDAANRHLYVLWRTVV